MTTRRRKRNPPRKNDLAPLGHFLWMGLRPKPRDIYRNNDLLLG